MTSRKRSPDWREFEKLVTRIEATLVPKGAIVRSPDRLRSLLTNRLREVDASIKVKLGTTDIVVTVECRKRKASQDVTWLEQLSSKKQALGVARTIAVSTSDFSSDAINVARHYGIDLRVVRDITALLTALKKWTFDLSMRRATSRRHIFEANVNGFPLILQVHDAKPFDDRAEQASVGLG